MRKLIGLLGLSITTLALPLMAQLPQGMDLKRHDSHECHTATSCDCDTDKLFAYSEGDGTHSLIAVGDLDTEDYEAEFDFYVPFFDVGLANNVSRIDDCTFKIKHKGVYQIIYSVGVDNGAEDASAIFALEAVDSFDSRIIPGSRLAFNSDSTDDLFQTISVLFYVRENNTAIRVADVISDGLDVRLTAADLDAVYASITIVQLSE